MHKYDVNKQAALSLQECIQKAKDYGTDDPESIHRICSSIVDKSSNGNGNGNNKKNNNNNKSRGGMSDTWSSVNQKDQTSYTQAPQTNPNAKNIKFPPKSDFATTSECVEKIMSDYGATHDVAVSYCTAPSIINNDNNNNNTKSASIPVPGSMYALGLAQKPIVNTLKFESKSKSKVAFHNADVVVIIGLPGLVR